MAGHINFSLAASNYGAAFGKAATGTQASPKFEVAYPSFFDNDMSVAGSVSAISFSGNGSSLANITAAKIYIYDPDAGDDVAYNLEIGDSSSTGSIGTITVVLPS